MKPRLEKGQEMLLVFYFAFVYCKCINVKIFSRISSGVLLLLLFSLIAGRTIVCVVLFFDLGGEPG